MMASEALELSSAGRDIPGHPDYRRLHSEENTAATKRPGIKKSISWGNRSDAMRTLSFQRKFITAQFHCKLKMLCFRLTSINCS